MHISYPIYPIYSLKILTMKGSKNLAYSRLLRPLREGSLSCQICCVTGPRFLRSHLKDRPNLVTFNEKQIILSIYSNADPHWTENRPSKVDISFQTNLKIFG